MSDLAPKIEKFNEKKDNKPFQHIILASQSAVRKQQLIDENIPFEVIVSNADETPDKSKTFKNQLAEISMRKAKVVFEKTIMMGKEDVYAYTGNSILLAEGKNILQSINITDVARMSVDKITENELESYLENEKCLNYCGGISISNSDFIHLKEGRMSTAMGMTLEYAKEMMSNLN